MPTPPHSLHLLRSRLCSHWPRLTATAPAASTGAAPPASERGVAPGRRRLTPAMGALSPAATWMCPTGTGTRTRPSSAAPSSSGGGGGGGGGGSGGGGAWGGASSRTGPTAHLSGLAAGASVAQRRIILSAAAALDAHAVPARAAGAAATAAAAAAGNNEDEADMVHSATGCKRAIQGTQPPPVERQVADNVGPPVAVCARATTAGLPHCTVSAMAPCAEVACKSNADHRCATPKQAPHVINQCGCPCSRYCSPRVRAHEEMRVVRRPRCGLTVARRCWPNPHPWQLWSRTVAAPHVHREGTSFFAQAFH